MNLIKATKNFQRMSNRATPVPAGGNRMADIKIINDDSVKFGAAADFEIRISPSPFFTRICTVRRETAVQ